MENFAKGSLAMLDSIIEATENGATTVVGGGDTVALLQGVPGSAEKLSHVSTGGGASLELVEGKKLPGVEALSVKDDILKAGLVKPTNEQNPNTLYVGGISYYVDK